MHTWRNICYSSVGSAVIKFKGSSIIHHLSRIRTEFMGPNSNVVNHSDSFDGVNTDHRRLPPLPPQIFASVPHPSIVNNSTGVLPRCHETNIPAGAEEEMLSHIQWHSLFSHSQSCSAPAHPSLSGVLSAEGRSPLPVSLRGDVS